MRTPHLSTRGFTIIELMITVALAAVMAVIAVPNMRTFILNSRISTTTNDLVRALQVARSESIKRGRFVAVCASADPTAETPACTEGNLSGWIVFEDTDQSFDRDDDEPVILTAVAQSGVIVLNDSTGIVSYGSSGFANAVPDEALTSVIVVCDRRGTDASGNSATSRAIAVADTGRVRVSRDYTEVAAAVDRLPEPGLCATADAPAVDDSEDI